MPWQGHTPHARESLLRQPNTSPSSPFVCFVGTPPLDSISRSSWPSLHVHLQLPIASDSQLRVEGWLTLRCGQRTPTPFGILRQMSLDRGSSYRKDILRRRSKAAGRLRGFLRTRAGGTPTSHAASDTPSALRMAVWVSMPAGVR